MSRHLICGFHLRLETPDCSPGSARYRMALDLEKDISEVLPYLNAELDGAEYHHDTRILLWNKGDRKVAFRSFEIALASVESREEAEALAKNIIDTVNDIWNRRDRITPKFEGKKPHPTVLDILKLLPRTNCRKCGFLSCMALAAALRSDSSKISLCPHLREGDLMDGWT